MASEERGKNDPVIRREMASYKVNNLVIDSPAFERFLFITYQLERGPFLPQKNDRESPCNFNVLLSIDLKTRLKLQLEPLLCI